MTERRYEDRSRAAQRLALGIGMTGGAAAAHEQVRRSTGEKSLIGVGRKALKAKGVTKPQGKYLAGWAATRGIQAAGVPLAAVGARDLVSRKQRRIAPVNVRDEALAPALHSTFAVPRPGEPAPTTRRQKKQKTKARLAATGGALAASGAGGAAGGALAARLAHRRSPLIYGVGTALGATAGTVAAAPVNRRVIRNVSQGEYDYTLGSGAHRKVSKMDPNDAAINTLARREQKELVRRKKKQSRYSMASAGLGLTALGLQSPRLAGVAVRRSQRLAQVKPLKAVADWAPKGKEISSTVGVGSLGVGAAGSLNFARINRSETKADQRSATALNPDRVRKSLSQIAKYNNESDYLSDAHDYATGGKESLAMSHRPTYQWAQKQYGSKKYWKPEHRETPPPSRKRYKAATGDPHHKHPVHGYLYHKPEEIDALWEAQAASKGKKSVSKMGEIDADKYLDSAPGKKQPYGVQRTLQDVDDYYRLVHGGRSKSERVQHQMVRHVEPEKAKARQAKVASEIKARRTIEGSLNLQNFIRHANGGKDPSDYDFAVADELGRRRKAGLPPAAKLRSKTEIRNLKGRQALVHEHRARGTQPPPRQTDPAEEKDSGFRDFGEHFYRQNPHPNLGNPYKSPSPHFKAQLDRLPAGRHRVEPGKPLKYEHASQKEFAKALIPRIVVRPKRFGGVKTGGFFRTPSGGTAYRRGSLG